MIRTAFFSLALFAASISSPAQPGQATQQKIDTHTRQAREFLKNNQPDLALREFSAIVALDPNHVDARNNLGVLLFFRGECAEAVPHLRAAVKLQPALVKTQALLGMCERRLGDAEHAEADLRESFPRLQEEKLRVDTGMELTELYFGAGEMEKAAGVVAALRQQRPDDPDLAYTAFRIYSALADEATLRVAMKAPGSARMHQIMGYELARQNDTQGAIAHYREALKISPTLPGAHFDLAEMLSATSDTDGAVKEYKAALAVNPFDARSECRLGELALRAGELQAASGHFSRALAVQPNDLDSTVGLAQVLLASNEPQKARSLLEKAVKLEPYDPPVRYHLAMVYRKLGQLPDSRRELAEFQRLKELKEKLRQTYRDMRLRPKADRADADLPKVEPAK